MYALRGKEKEICKREKKKRTIAKNCVKEKSRGKSHIKGERRKKRTGLKSKSEEKNHAEGEKGNIVRREVKENNATEGKKGKKSKAEKKGKVN